MRVAIKDTWSMQQLTSAYVREFVSLHGVTKDIISIRLIQEHMKAAQDRQKAYADQNRRGMEFEVGEKALLKVSPTKGVMRFGRKGKSSPRYIRPCEILERIGEVAYRLALLVELSNVHNVFHVSQLRKYAHDPIHIIPPEAIQLDETLSFEQHPVRIFDTKTRST
ncbi:uncharacterized protein LOC104883282 [Beta vulgaris subsp. vulgaris]|uniref:uncharacterized protein LOC104883282 n=1 Tax=Beta vulgaris subsp. vulgaris TaxID=3555 RepID=UPI002037361A|nr:uncharacterized protein LOC104883282 [Beta vulgaris subsp. vulgaris]